MRNAPLSTRRSFLVQSGLGTLALVIGCTPEDGEPKETGGGDSGGDSGGADSADSGGADTGAEVDPWGDPPTDCSAPTEHTGTGPFYREGMPERTDLNPLDEEGTPVRIYFRVLDQSCAPLAGCLVEVWHCAPEASYDMSTEDYRFYGSQLTDAEGRGFVETLRPPVYVDDAGEHAPHIHFQLTLTGYRVIATQIQFEEDDDESGMYPVVTTTTGSDGVAQATLNFVLQPDEAPPA